MIIEKIKSDYNEYRKQRHAAGIAALSTVIGELGRLPNKTETDAAVLKVVDNVYNGIKECQAQKPSQENEAQIAVLEQYKPKQMTDTELQELVASLVTTNGFVSIKDVMNHLQQNYAGRYNGKAASVIAKAALGL